ncbi:MAG: hypothetical protein SPK00_09340 [Corynebacterium glucuronolyticum]|nr:hypothetical protein [Corynebacterium glucuronolyticum]
MAAGDSNASREMAVAKDLAETGTIVVVTIIDAVTTAGIVNLCRKSRMSTFLA